MFLILKEIPSIFTIIEKILFGGVMYLFIVLVGFILFLGLHIFLCHLPLCQLSLFVLSLSLLHTVGSQNSSSLNFGR